MTQPTDAKSTELDEMLTYFQKRSEDAQAIGEERIKELQALVDRVDAQIRQAEIDSPLYYRFCGIKDSLNDEISLQLHEIADALAHYILSLRTAIAVTAVLRKQSPTLDAELANARKKLDDHFVRRTAQLAKLFSAEGHEAMYGAGTRSEDSTS